MNNLLMTLKANKFLVIFFGIGSLLLLFSGSSDPIKQHESSEKSSYKQNDILIDKNINYAKYQESASQEMIKRLEQEISALKNEIRQKRNTGGDMGGGGNTTLDNIENAAMKGKDYIAEKLQLTQSAIQKDNTNTNKANLNQSASMPKKKQRRTPIEKTSKTVTFPVAFKKRDKQMTITSGSRVKGMLYTGVDAGFGEKEPVLIALEEEVILPNNYEADLKGCVALGKASGMESKERVCIQVYKLACFTSSGKSIERKMNAFIVDDKDAKHCAIGKVKVKAEKAIYKSALAEMISGAGQIMAASNAITNVTPLGGVTSVLSKTSAQNILGGGISAGAKEMAKWLRSVGKMSMPYVELGAGRPIWIVNLESFKVPLTFIKRKELEYENNNSVLL